MHEPQLEVYLTRVSPSYSTISPLPTVIATRSALLVLQTPLGEPPSSHNSTASITVPSNLAVAIASSVKTIHLSQPLVYKSLLKSDSFFSSDGVYLLRPILTTFNVTLSM